MKHLKYIGILISIFISQIGIAQTKKIVNAFEKVIISPHIEATFIEGSEESVTITESTESENKVNIEVNGNTLRIYLDDAKETTKNKTIISNGIKKQVPIYKGKVLTVIVTYKKLKALSIRGEQSTLCKSDISTDIFKLKIYGESKVTFNQVQFQDFQVSIYGESTLAIQSGTITNQKITAYGEAIIDLIQVHNKISKLKAFGEATFKIQSSDHIKMTALGEAVLLYKGNPAIKKGLNIGDVKITQVG